MPRSGGFGPTPCPASVDWRSPRRGRRPLVVAGYVAGAWVTVVALVLGLVVAVNARGGGTLYADRPPVPTWPSLPVPSSPTSDTAPPPQGPTEIDARPYLGGGVGASAVGKLELRSSDGGLYSCSASVVRSTSRSVLATAAHCLYGDKKFPDSSQGWKDGTFAPAYREGTAPFGRWSIDRVALYPSWIDRGAAGGDIAFLSVEPRNGRFIEDVVGAFAIDWSPERTVIDPATVRVLGYPAEEPFDGETLRTCASANVTTQSHLWVGESLPTPEFAIRCDMTGGSSGGPWLADFDPVTGTGLLVGLTRGGSPSSLTAIQVSRFHENLFLDVDQP